MMLDVDKDGRRVEAIHVEDCGRRRRSTAVRRTARWFPIQLGRGRHGPGLGRCAAAGRGGDPG